MEGTGGGGRGRWRCTGAQGPGAQVTEEAKAGPVVWCEAMRLLVVLVGWVGGALALTCYHCPKVPSRVMDCMC